jgi:hypothetical protein
MAKPKKTKPKTRARDRVRRHVQAKAAKKPALEAFLEQIGDVIENALVATTCDEHDVVVNELITWAAEIVLAHRDGGADDHLAEHAKLVVPDQALYRLFQAMLDFQIRTGVTNDALADYLISRLHGNAPSAEAVSRLN